MTGLSKARLWKKKSLNKLSKHSPVMLLLCSMYCVCKSMQNVMCLLNQFVLKWDSWKKTLLHVTQHLIKCIYFQQKQQDDSWHWVYQKRPNLNDAIPQRDLCKVCQLQWNGFYGRALFHAPCISSLLYK